MSRSETQMLAGVRPMRRSAALAIALAALAVASCGGGDDGDSTGLTGSSTYREDAEARQERADAEVRKRNEEVRERFRQREGGRAPTEEEREAKQAVTNFYEILGEDEGGREETMIDSAAFCELMTEEARRQTVDYARLASGEAKNWDCEQAIELLVLRSKRTGGLEQARRAEVIGVNTEGDRATASIRFGKGPVTSISLAREDGEWKLAARPSTGG